MIVYSLRQDELYKRNPIYSTIDHNLVTMSYFGGSAPSCAGGGMDVVLRPSLRAWIGEE